ncbi:MAG TPA: hypothetical protein VLA39_06835 [Marinobacterium sp.]|nr:hypothetical protein [Marinobacterium sp.]
MSDKQAPQKPTDNPLLTLSPKEQTASVSETAKQSVEKQSPSGAETTSTQPASASTVTSSTASSTVKKPKASTTKAKKVAKPDQDLTPTAAEAKGAKAVKKRRSKGAAPKITPEKAKVANKQSVVEANLTTAPTTPVTEPSKVSPEAETKIPVSQATDNQHTDLFSLGMKVASETKELMELEYQTALELNQNLMKNLLAESTPTSVINATNNYFYASQNAMQKAMDDRMKLVNRFFTAL